MSDEVTYIKNSKYRTKIMKALQGDVKIPSQLSRETGVHLTHVSHTLSDLRQRGYIECINPEEQRGRLYRLTENGEKLAEKL